MDSSKLCEQHWCIKYFHELPLRFDAAASLKPCINIYSVQSGVES